MESRRDAQVRILNTGDPKIPKHTIENITYLLLQPKKLTPVPKLLHVFLTQVLTLNKKIIFDGIFLEQFQFHIEFFLLVLWLWLTYYQKNEQVHSKVEPPCHNGKVYCGVIFELSM